ERNPTGNIIGDHVIIGRSGFQLKNKNRSKGIKI
ncbi:DNA methylase, partial [Bacteroides thetaiotaomicron]